MNSEFNTDEMKKVQNSKLTTFKHLKNFRNSETVREIRVRGKLLVIGYNNTFFSR